MKKNLLIIICIATSFQCCGQSKIQNNEFAKFVETFTEIKKSPFCFKTNFNTKTLKKIDKQDALKFFGLTEDDLRFNDFEYNFDDDIKYDNWTEAVPYKREKLLEANFVALIYTFSKVPTYGIDTTRVILQTFTYAGDSIDKIEICSQYTREEDWKDVVFLENRILRIFDYKPNLENHNVKNSTYYIIDKEQPQTIVEIKDYQIDENGKINLIKKYPKQYLKEFVSFYRNYHADSDDPMNEYK